MGDCPKREWVNGMPPPIAVTDRMGSTLDAGALDPTKETRNGALTSSRPTLSVIIVTYNSAAKLRPTLEAVMAQHHPNYEVILYDNNSTDGTLAIARPFQAQGLKVIASPENRGFSGGNNDAVEASRGELLVLLNPDAVLRPGGLVEIERAFVQNPRMGILGAKLLAPDGRTIMHCGGRIGMPAHTELYGRGEIDRGQWDEPMQVELVIGALLVIPRSLWVQLGGFDEFFNPTYFEDTDLCYRCRRLGRPVVYWPRVCLIHSENVSQAYKSWRFFWAHHKGRIWFTAKNLPLWRLVFQAIPAEAAWFVSPRGAAGLRPMMLRIYWMILKRFLARRILRLKPLQERRGV